VGLQEVLGPGKRLRELVVSCETERVQGDSVVVERVQRDSVVVSCEVYTL
jgi:hypothetical protein